MAWEFRHKRMRNRRRGVVVNGTPYPVDERGHFTVSDAAIARHLWASLGPAGRREIEQVGGPSLLPPPEVEEEPEPAPATTATQPAVAVSDEPGPASETAQTESETEPGEPRRPRGSRRS